MSISIHTHLLCFQLRNVIHFVSTVECNVHIGLFISVNLVSALVCVVSCRPWLRIVSLCCGIYCLLSIHCHLFFTYRLECSKWIRVIQYLYAATLLPVVEIFKKLTVYL